MATSNSVKQHRPLERSASASVQQPGGGRGPPPARRVGRLLEVRAHKAVLPQEDACQRGARPPPDLHLGQHRSQHATRRRHRPRHLRAQTKTNTARLAMAPRTSGPVERASFIAGGGSCHTQRLVECVRTWNAALKATGPPHSAASVAPAGDCGGGGGAGGGGAGGALPSGPGAAAGGGGGGGGSGSAWSCHLSTRREPSMAAPAGRTRAGSSKSVGTCSLRSSPVAAWRRQKQRRHRLASSLSTPMGSPSHQQHRGARGMGRCRSRVAKGTMQRRAKQCRRGQARRAESSSLSHRRRRAALSARRAAAARPAARPCPAPRPGAWAAPTPRA